MLVVGSSPDADPHAYQYDAGSRERDIDESAAKEYSDQIVAENMPGLAALNMNGTVAGWGRGGGLRTTLRPSLLHAGPCPGVATDVGDVLLL